MLRRSFPLMRPRKIVRATEKMPHFDVCVIGAGPAGVCAALRAVDYAKSVCLIEKDRVGGADLWNGALQSKTMWEMSKFMSSVAGDGARRIFDTDVTNYLKLDEDRMRESLQLASGFREKQVLHALKEAEVKLIFGAAMFASPHEISVHSNETGEYHTITADYFIIATGSSPRDHPHFPTDGRRIVTSDEIMQQPIPKSLVVVGAGVIGCEFASIYTNLGQTKVHIIDKAPRILPMEDEDIAMYVQSLLEKKGVIVHHEVSLFDLQAWDEADGSGGGVQYTIQHNRTREMKTIEVEKALVSIGRNSNYKGLGLENLKCRVQDGKLKVDDFQRCTPHDHIYAIGDATMDIALVNMGEAEARLAIDHIYSCKKETIRFVDNLSTIMFLDEEVAAVGLNEQQCQKQNISYMVAKYGYEFVSRAVAMGDTKGFIKILVTNDRQKQVLGVRAVGPHASSIVELASLAIHDQESAYELSELMTAYPAITQGFQECLRMLLGRSILKPNVFPQLILKTWTPPNYERGRALQKTVHQSRAREAEKAKERTETEKIIKQQVAEATKQAVADMETAAAAGQQKKQTQ